MAVGQAPAASILAPAASILAPARILQYFQYTGKRYQYTVLAPLEQPVQHTKKYSNLHDEVADMRVEVYCMRGDGLKFWQQVGLFSTSWQTT